MSTLSPDSAPDSAGPSHFIREIILEDLKTGKYDGRVVGDVIAARF